MSDRFTELLSDYLDHDLPHGEAEAVERHLAGCAECRDTLAALDSVKARAAALVDPPVPTDLWAGIASRIGPAGSSSASFIRRALAVRGPAAMGYAGPTAPSRRLPVRARGWGVPQWAAAAAAFAVVALGLSWFAQDRLRPVLRQAADPTRVSPGPIEASTASFDATRIETEIGQLQQALARGHDKLDPKTVQVLEENLRIIQKATEDARQALRKDPANRDLQDYFTASVQSKLNLVRRAAALAGV